MNDADTSLRISDPSVTCAASSAELQDAAAAPLAERVSIEARSDLERRRLARASVCAMKQIVAELNGLASREYDSEQHKSLQQLAGQVLIQAYGADLLTDEPDLKHWIDSNLSLDDVEQHIKPDVAAKLFNAWVGGKSLVVKRDEAWVRDHGWDWADAVLPGNCPAEQAYRAPFPLGGDAQALRGRRDASLRLDAVACDYIAAVIDAADVKAVVKDGPWGYRRWRHGGIVLPGTMDMTAWSLAGFLHKQLGKHVPWDCLHGTGAPFENIIGRPTLQKHASIATCWFRDRKAFLKVKTDRDGMVMLNTKTEE